jgi:hypothetical protein
MARLTSDIVYNVTGQTLEYRVPQGQPTSATFAARHDYDSDDTAGEFTGAATVDNVEVAVTGLSGPSQDDPQLLYIESTTGITVDRKYLVSESGRKEWVQPVEIVTDNYIRCRYPLRNEYTTAATLASTYITAAVDSTWIADLDNISDPRDPNPGYRMRWTVVVAGVTYIAYSYFDVVRAPVSYQVDIDDVNARAPGLAMSIPTEYETEQGRPLLESAWRSVQARLATVDTDVDAFRNDQVLDELVILKSLQLLAGGGWKPLGYDSLAQYVIDTSTNFETYFQQMIAVVTKPRMATDNSGAAQRVIATPYWSK